MDTESITNRVKKSSQQDFRDEQACREREAWGSWLQELRIAKIGRMYGKSKKIASGGRQRVDESIRRLAFLSDMKRKTLDAFEAGHQEPTLSEAARIAEALGVTLDVLAKKPKPNEDWQEDNRARSNRRALVFHGRLQNEGDVEVLKQPATKLVWEHVREKNEERARRQWGSKRQEA
jgi:transcriptional regulator with XRE-family HTH domain